MGALAHWLWIGDHFDPHNVLAWVFLLLGPLMVFVWAVVKTGWWMLLAFCFTTGALFALCWVHRQGRLGEAASGHEALTPGRGGLGQENGLFLACPKLPKTNSPYESMEAFDRVP